MTRLCFIGDSHLACIKKAWEAEPRDVATTFFALPGRSMQYIESREGALGSSFPEVTDFLKFTSGGLDRIESSYDVYALHGMQLGIVKALELCRAAWGKGQSPSAELFADAAFRAALRSAIEESIAAVMLGKLRTITQAPVMVMPTPMADATFPKLRSRLVKTQAAPILVQLFHDECKEVFGALNAAFLPQPAETLAEDGLATAPQYSLEPVRFRARPTQDDGLHMNTQYGAAVIAALLGSPALR